MGVVDGGHHVGNEGFCILQSAAEAGDLVVDGVIQFFDVTEKSVHPVQDIPAHIGGVIQMA